MRARTSFAIVLVAAWLLQLSSLWPLPSETGPWLDWTERVLLMPLGIASGILMLADHPRWPSVLAVVSVAALVVLRVWQWWGIVYAPLFGPFALDRAAWLAMRPMFLFDTLAFPLLLLIAIFYAALHARPK